MTVKEGQRLVAALAVLITLSGCVGVEPDRLVAKQDHQGLALHHTYEARGLRQRAAEWERLAERYESPRGQAVSADAGAFAARCRTIAGLMKQAADEADRLAAMHRQAAEAGAPPAQPE